MRRRFNSEWGPGRRVVSPQRFVRRRVGRTITAAGVRRAALGRAGLYASRLNMYGAAAYGGYRAFKYLRNRRRVNARRRVGERIGSTSSKTRLLEGTDTIDTKTLNDGLRLLSLPKTSTNNEAVLNDRLRNVVDFRGVKVCFHTRVNTKGASFDGDKLFFNWAIISPKAESNELASIDTGEFFRGQDGARFTSFIGTTLTGLDLHCLGINTDKYIVHRHRRLTMGPWESPNGLAEKYFETYVPVKRQIRYNATGTGAVLDYPEGKDMWMVYWCSYMKETAAAAPTTGAVTVNFRITQVFKEPKR